jgi:hypothetical protein
VNSVAIDNITIPQAVQHIIGDVSVSGIPVLASFAASGLQSISGTFDLFDLSTLQTLTIPNLISVGSINFTLLPLLQTMNLGINEAKNVSIMFTGLSYLDGISLSSVNDLGVSMSFSSSI